MRDAVGEREREVEGKEQRDREGSVCQRDEMGEDRFIKGGQRTAGGEGLRGDEGRKGEGGRELGRTG